MGKIVQKRAQQYKKTAIVLITFSLIVLAIAGFFGYQKFMEFNMLKDSTASNSLSINDADGKKANLEGPYTKGRADFVAETKNRDAKIESIFPESEELTELTRLLDQFFVDNNFSNDAIVLNSLTFGNIEEDENFRSMRFTMNIQGSENNFFKFLDFISKSGNFTRPYRLMAIENINLTFPAIPEVEEGAPTVEALEDLNFTVQAVAYFQK